MTITVELLFLLLLLRHLTTVVAKDTETVVDSDPCEDTLFLAAQNARVEAGSVEERLKGRFTHQRVDETYQRVHRVLEQQPQP